MAPARYVRITSSIALLGGPWVAAGTIGRVLDAPEVGANALVVEVPQATCGVVLTSDDVAPSTREAWDAQGGDDD
jgi:hypothetical protein